MKFALYMVLLGLGNVVYAADVLPPSAMVCGSGETTDCFKPFKPEDCAKQTDSNVREACNRFLAPKEAGETRRAVDKQGVAEMMSERGDPWVAKNLRALGCADASVSVATLDHGYGYRFKLSVSAKDNPIGLNSFHTKYSERFDLNGSTDFPGFEWTDEIKAQNYVLQPLTNLTVIRAKNDYSVTYRPDDQNFNDEHADLIIAYSTKYYEQKAGNWEGPHERVTSCILYRVVGQKA